MAAGLILGGVIALTAAPSVAQTRTLVTTDRMILGSTEDLTAGIVFADIDNDGDKDVIYANGRHWAQTNEVYLNNGTGLFSVGYPLGPMKATTYAVPSGDLDGDGDLDIYGTNGPGADNVLYSNQFVESGSVTFVDVAVTANAGLNALDSNGVCFGDIDNDGDTDVVLTNNGGPARLLVNNFGQERHWIGLRLVAGKPSRDQLGARVGVLRKDRPTLWRRVESGGSFAVANDPRILVGLGDSPQVDGLEVIWPDGFRENFSAPAGRYSTLMRGQGKPARPDE